MSESNDDEPFVYIYGFLLLVGLIFLIGKLEFFIWGKYGRPIGVLSIIVIVFLAIKYGDIVENIFEQIVKGLSGLTWIVIAIVLLVLFIKWVFA